MVSHLSCFRRSMFLNPSGIREWTVFDTPLHASPGSDHLRRQSDSWPCPRCALLTCFGMGTSHTSAAEIWGAFQELRTRTALRLQQNCNTSPWHPTLEACQLYPSRVWDLKSFLETAWIPEGITRLASMKDSRLGGVQIFLSLYFISVT